MLHMRTTLVVVKRLSLALSSVLLLRLMRVPGIYEKISQDLLIPPPQISRNASTKSPGLRFPGSSSFTGVDSMTSTPHGTSTPQNPLYHTVTPDVVPPAEAGGALGLSAAEIDALMAMPSRGELLVALTNKLEAHLATLLSTTKSRVRLSALLAFSAYVEQGLAAGTFDPDSMATVDIDDDDDVS